MLGGKVVRWRGGGVVRWRGGEVVRWHLLEVYYSPLPFRLPSSTLSSVNSLLQPHLVEVQVQVEVEVHLLLLLVPPDEGDVSPERVPEPLALPPAAARVVEHPRAGLGVGYERACGKHRLLRDNT